MAKTDIYTLHPNGTFAISRVRPETHWPHHLRDTKNGQAHSLIQTPVLEQVQPARFDTWAEFMASGPPLPHIRPRKYMMFTEAGRFFPLGLGETPSDKEKQVEIDALYETSFQKAVSGGSRDDLENRFLSQGFLMIVGVSCLIVLVLVAIVVVNVLLPGAEVQAPPAPPAVPQ